MMRPTLLTLLTAVSVAAGCGSEARAGSTAWTGTVDTLPSGQIVVRNTAEPLWRPGTEWKVVEELRIGTLDGDGPDLFGRISSLTVDGDGRIWALDGQAQELRVFDPDGRYVRTVGRRGAGPGEFTAALHVDLGPDGNVYVMDPQNNRISVVDSDGAFVDSKWASGGFIMIPWPGGFDARGRYFAPVPRMNGGGFGVALVRHDRSFESADTLDVPVDPVTREFFELSGEGRSMRAAVPFQGGLIWRFGPRGTIWALRTDQYRLFELAETGDTIRTVTREFEMLPVTLEDREQALEGLIRFREAGGRVDASRIPSTRPPVANLFFFDDQENLWVRREATSPDGRTREHDVFDPEGRYLGVVTLPFPLSSAPVIRDGKLYGVTTDELEVQYVVRARIERPS